MIVKCEACGTKYRLDDSKVKPEGVKVRCSRCGHVFTFHPPTGPPVGEGVPSEAEAPSSTEPFTEELPWEEPLPSEEGMGVSVEKGRRWLMVVLLVVLLGLLAVAVLLFNRERIPLVDKIFGKVVGMIETNGHLLPLSHLRGYRLVVSGKEIFVIEGRVTNRSKDVRRWVKLEGRLLDKGGRVVAKGVGFAGRYLPRGEIEGMALSLLEDFARRRRPSGVTPLAPGDVAPFAILFVSPPSRATDFEVEVLEAPTL